MNRMMVSVLAAALGRIDCLLLTGGEDVEPSRYGRTREPRCGKANVRRDAYDWALLDAAVARRLPPERREGRSCRAGASKREPRR